MKYLICSALDQTAIISKNTDCFQSCKKKAPLSSEWNFCKCCNGNGWCCAQIYQDQAIRLFVPQKIKKQNVRTYFSAILDNLTELTGNNRNKDVNAKNISDIIVHNSKNIHSNIVSKYENIFPNINLSTINKAEYVLSIIRNAEIHQAIEFLSIWKSLNQQTFQYSLHDFVEAKQLSINEFSNQEIYKLVQMSFYQYEDDFNERKIHVHLNPFADKVICNFDTTKCAFCSIFENCIKYCLPNRDIDISFEKKQDKVIIKFEMMSRVIDESESKAIFEHSFRGKYVKDLPGKGIGMWVVKKMMDLNFSTVEVFPSTNIFSQDGGRYGYNVFIFELNTCKRQILEKMDSKIVK